MEKRKWFAYVSGQVHGPFDRPDLETKLSTWNNPLIWGRGQAEWVEPQKWLEEIHRTEEMIHSSQINTTQTWRVRNGDQETKALSHDQMMSYLKNIHDFSQVKLWTEGYADWREIFHIHKIMDDLGVSRRTHPRVPIMGILSCEGPGIKANVRLQSISEGGLGVIEANALKIGNQLRCTIKSSNLTLTISVSAEVVYATSAGYAGLKFTGLPTESKTLIIEYVQKFQKAK